MDLTNDEKVCPFVFDLAGVRMASVATVDSGRFVKVDSLFDPDKFADGLTL